MRRPYKDEDRHDGRDASSNDIELEVQEPYKGVESEVKVDLYHASDHSIVRVLLTLLFQVPPYLAAQC